MECAARAGLIETGLIVAREVDALHTAIESWSVVGLGRMTTESCYELASCAQSAAHGHELWALAQHWRSELDGLSLQGLEIAARAARKWGSVAEQTALRADIEAEQRRIATVLRKLDLEDGET